MYLGAASFWFIGGRALNELGDIFVYQTQSNSEYLLFATAVRLRGISFVVERETTQIDS